MSQGFRWFTAVSQGLMVSITVCVLLVTFFVTFPQLETRYFPVVTKLQIDLIEPAAEGRSAVYVSFAKLRGCEYIGMAWFEQTSSVDKDRVTLELYRAPGDITTPSRPVGRQSSGPWVVDIPPDRLRADSIVEVTHRCHPFWSTVTQFYP